MLNEYWLFADDTSLNHADLNIFGPNDSDDSDSDNGDGHIPLIVDPRLCLPSTAQSLHFDEPSKCYMGKSDHYSIRRNTVAIHLSDGVASKRPLTNEGCQFLPLDDITNLSWRRWIGRLICGALFMGKGEGAISSLDVV